MTLKIAITGTGYITKIHARSVSNTPDAEVVAVVNHRTPSMDAFAAEFGLNRKYSTVEALLADGDVDALVVGTPNYLHASQTMKALKAGVPVMVEKPMAMDVAEAEQMQASAEESGAALMVAHCWRFDAEVLWLRDQVTAGALGEIVRTKGYGVHSNWGPAGWFTRRKFAGGGALADMGIHALDTVRFLLGDPLPVSVYARIGTHYTDYDVDDTGVIIVNWGNGTSSYIESGWWQPHMDGPEAATQLYGVTGFGQVFPTYLLLSGEDGPQRVESGFPAERDPHCPQDMYDAQMAYFLQCVRDRRRPTPGESEGLWNMRVVAAAYQSAQTNLVVHL